MKKQLQNASLFLILPLLASISACNKGASKEPALTTDKAKVSYVIGQQIGMQLKTEKLDVDTDVLAASIGEVLAGKKARLSQEEMMAAMQKVQGNAQAQQEADGKANLEKGQKFLADNKAKPNVKTTASGLQYEVITEGKGASPKATDTVKVHYKGTLIDGTVFDNSYDRGTPIEFPLNGVIKGWTEGLQLVKVGSKTKFVIPAELAYGSMARPAIPANSTLVFEVELLDIVKAKKK